MSADKPTVLTTARATVFGWVNILKADFKFNDAGDYKIKVKLPKNTKGLSDQLEAIEEAASKAKAEFLKNPKNKGKRVKDADLPFYEDQDDGTIVMSFKSKASWTDTKTGERRERTIPVFGGAGRLKPGEIPQFGEGSVVRVAFTIGGFCNVAVGAGASLRIDSIKLIEVKQFSGGGAANHFGDDEDGYTPEDSDGGNFSDDDGDGYTPDADGSDDF